MHPALLCVAEKQDRQHGIDQQQVLQRQDGQHDIDQQQVLQRVELLLAAIAAFLFSVIVGTWDSSLGSIMAKRGLLASVSAALSSANRCFSSSIERRGASPKLRSAFRSTGNRV